MLSTNVFPQRQSSSRQSAKQKLITFQIGFETYGLPIDRIKQIVDEFNPHGVLDNGHGLVRYQNQTLTLLYPTQLFPASDSSQRYDYLMIAIAQGQTVGIPLPQLPRVMEVTEQQFRPVPDLYRQVGISPAIKALIHLEQGTNLFVLDLEQLVLLQTQPIPINPTHQPVNDTGHKLQVLDLPKHDFQQPALPEQSLLVQDFPKQDFPEQDHSGQGWEAIDFQADELLELGEQLLAAESSTLGGNFLAPDLIDQNEILPTASAETWQVDSSFKCPDFECSDFDLELGQQLEQEAESFLSESSSDLANDNLQDYSLEDHIVQTQNPESHNLTDCDLQEDSLERDEMVIAPHAEAELVSGKLEDKPFETGELEMGELEIGDLEMDELEFKFDGFEISEFDIDKFNFSDADEAFTFEHLVPNKEAIADRAEPINPTAVSNTPKELSDEDINLPGINLLDPDLIEQGEMLLADYADLWDIDDNLEI
jgi:chemotaxis signal transduction protein